jgi:negative regulator of flagellin synthesis FlgM|tara:strand:+ start:242 stop:541 length:300 start_codon:yes stop_codon:yes gene_type:complete
MIDKVNNITSGNSQSKRSIDENKVNKTAGDNRVIVNKSNSSDTDNVKISQELGVANLSKEAPLDLDKVSAIKNALSRGDYPIDLEKVADALLQAYKDIK